VFNNLWCKKEGGGHKFESCSVFHLSCGEVTHQLKYLAAGQMDADRSLEGNDESVAIRK